MSVCRQAVSAHLVLVAFFHALVVATDLPGPQVLALILRMLGLLFRPQAWPLLPRLQRQTTKFSSNFLMEEFRGLFRQWTPAHYLKLSGGTSGAETPLVTKLRPVAITCLPCSWTQHSYTTHCPLYLMGSTIRRGSNTADTTATKYKVCKNCKISIIFNILAIYTKYFGWWIRNGKKTNPRIWFLSRLQNDL